MATPDIVSRLRSLYDLEDYWHLYILVLVGAYVFLVGLGNAPLRNWDEAIYANAARHAVQDGDWLIPHLYWLINRDNIHLLPFLQKPPLMLWLQALSMGIFGVTRFAARLPAALMGVLLGPVIYTFGKQLYDRHAGFIAALVVMTTPMVFGGHGGRTANLDVPMLLFGTVFVYLSWLALTKRCPELLPYVGVAAGIALLIKGFNAGIFVVGLAPLALYHYRQFLNRETVKMAGITALLALPWPLLAWYRYGPLFEREFFFMQVLRRATGEEFVSQSGTLFPFMRYRYFQELPAQFDPWIWALGPAVAIVLYHGWRRAELEMPLFLVWWMASTFGFFVLTGNHGWYVMPMFVPAALVIGGAFVIVRDSLPTERMVAAFGRSGTAMPAVAALLVVLTLAAPAPLDTPEDRFSGEERFGMAIADRVPPDETVYVESNVTFRRPLFVVSFYAQRPLESMSVARMNNETDIRWAITLSDSNGQLQREYEVKREWGGLSLVRFARDN